jgi:hypothetical protein
MSRKSLVPDLAQIEIRVSSAVYGESYGSISDPPSLALIGSAFTIPRYFDSHNYIGPLSLQITPEKITADPIDGRTPFGLLQILEDNQMFATVHIEGADLLDIYARTIDALDRTKSRVSVFLQVSPSFETQRYGDFLVVSLTWSWRIDRDSSEP